MGAAGWLLLASSLLLALPVLLGAGDPFLRRTATVRAVEKVGPAVVNITSERTIRRESPFRHLGGDPFFEQFFRDFFDPRRQLGSQPVTNLGSGVLIDAEGHVLTNEHVVSRADQIRVTLADGREFQAVAIGADPNNDLAVLRVEGAKHLPWIPPGQSADLFVGEPVIAIGNPFGLSNTVTTGVISAIDRSFHSAERTFHGFLQTDASINPGNSGGPLLNAEGSLIGINTAIYNGAQGIGFAIPIDTARRVAMELIAHGSVTPVWLGLDFQDLDPNLRGALDLPDGFRGVLITRVREKSPAGRAGLRRGDIVTRVDGRPLASAREIFQFLETVLVDHELSLELWRNAKSERVRVRVEEIPGDHIRVLTREYLGLELQALAEGDGYAVTRVLAGTQAERIGFRPGDVLIAVNGRALRGEEDLRRAILDLSGRSHAIVVVQRGHGRYPVTIPLV